MSRRRRVLITTTVMALVSIIGLSTVGLVTGLAAPPAAWPQFRGPGSLGVAETSRIPARWSPTENVAWVAEVPGRGWSSPVVWGDRVFVTTAISPGAFKEPSTGIYGNDDIAEWRKQGLSPEEVSRRVRARDNESPDEVGAEVVWRLLCFDAITGARLWETEIHRGRPVVGRHRKNTYASETPATNGRRLYVYVGNVGLFAYSLDGARLWKTSLERKPIYLDFGTASSPIVADGRTGRVIYKVRIGEGGVAFSASPWIAGDRIFCLSEDGDTYVIQPGDEYKLVAVKSLVEMSLATPAVTDDGLFVRTATKLYRIGRPSARGSG